MILVKHNIKMYFAEKHDGQIRFDIFGETKIQKIFKQEFKL